MTNSAGKSGDSVIYDSDYDNTGTSCCNYVRLVKVGWCC